MWKSTRRNRLTVGIAFRDRRVILVLVGPTLLTPSAKRRDGEPVRVTWLVLQWPLVFVWYRQPSDVYYFGPDADQDWSWITPGRGCDVLWLVVSLIFKVYIANFTDYNAHTGRLAVSSCCSCGFTCQVSQSSPVRTQRGDRARIALRKAPGRRTRTKTDPRTSR